MEDVGIFILICITLVIWIFKDNTKLDAGKREIQKLESEIQILELKAKLESLKKKEKNETEN